MPSENLFQVRDLTVSYNAAAFPALDGVSFDLACGEAVGLLGESGSGKSSLAMALVRLLPPGGHIAGGSIRFRGRELLEIGERELEEIRGSEISVIFQEPALALNPVMRVGQQVAEVIRAHRPWSWRRCREEAGSVLAEVGLGDTGRIYSAYPCQLSGGQRQRVVIAQGVACRPALLIADEPTAALDTTAQAEILDLLRMLKDRRKMALLFISHNPAVLARLADRILVLQAGRVIEEGTVTEVCRHSRHLYTQALLRPIPSRKGPG